MRRRLVLLLAAAGAVTGAVVWRRRRHTPAPAAQLGLDDGAVHQFAAGDPALPELLRHAAGVRRALEAGP
jgi:uncharacterized membrane protein